MSSATQLLKNSFRRLNESRILNYAAQLSYGLMLAFLPMLMLFNWVVNTFFRTGNLADTVMNFADTYLPDQFAQLVDSSLKTEIIPGTVGLSSILGNIALIFFVFYAAARFLRALMVVSTSILKQKETRNFIKIWFLAFRDLFLILILFALTFYLYLETRVIIVDFLNTLHVEWLSNFVEGLYNKLVNVYLFSIVFVVVTWTMSRLPAKRFTFLQAAPGTVFIIVSFILLAVGVHYYNKFMSYEGVIMVVDQGMTIVITVYLISLIILLGELFNQFIVTVTENRKKPGPEPRQNEEESENEDEV